MCVALHSLYSSEQLEGLRQRSLDIALVCDPPAADDPDLERVRVLSDPMMLALPEGHPLARPKGLAAVRPGRAGMDRGAPPRNGRTSPQLRGGCVRSGFTPHIKMEASEPVTALSLVAAGLGVAMVQQGLRHQVPPGVVLRELPWFDYRAPLWAAWHRINLRPLVATFRETLLELAATAD
jgi:DNA-binding transcriptional LysR family regulator